MDKALIFPMEDKYQTYLMDEAKFSGWAESISFPRTEEEIRQILEELRRQQIPVTIQGGKTGIVGGAIPEGGHIMNLSGFHGGETRLQPMGEQSLVVKAGLQLQELDKLIASRFRHQRLFWPPQPTETSATVGGVLAANAKGINYCRYGDSRQYVRQIRLLLADGSVRCIRRGEVFYRLGNQVVDELDCLLGSEGICGLILEAELCLLPRPEITWGMSFFFQREEDAAAFAAYLPVLNEGPAAYFTAVEYLDRRTLELIEKNKANMTKIKEIPDIAANICGMLYIEAAGEGLAVEEMAGGLLELAESCRSDPEASWAVSGEKEVERMRSFRHAAAETANLYIESQRQQEPSLRKLATDIAFGQGSFGDLLAAYRQQLREKGLDACIFGHVLECHLHVNILPTSRAEYERGQALLEKWTRQADQRQAVLAAEHGFGKMKRSLAGRSLSQEEQQLLLQLKQKYDPGHCWNRGNIFPGQAIS